jgi:hypothetical protein
MWPMSTLSLNAMWFTSKPSLSAMWPMSTLSLNVMWTRFKHNLGATWVNGA